MTQKLDALIYIHDIVTSEEEENKKLIKQKANVLLQALRLVLREVFDKPRNEVPTKFLIYFLNMSHKLCSIRIFLKVKYLVNMS